MKIIHLWTFPSHCNVLCFDIERAFENFTPTTRRESYVTEFASSPRRHAVLVVPIWHIAIALPWMSKHEYGRWGDGGLQALLSAESRMAPSTRRLDINWRSLQNNNSSDRKRPSPRAFRWVLEWGSSDATLSNFPGRSTRNRPVGH